MKCIFLSVFALCAALCLSVLVSSHPINQEFGFLEDIENEIIKDTIKTTVKTLIENAQSAVSSGKDFDEVIQKLGEARGQRVKRRWMEIAWQRPQAAASELNKLVSIFVSNSRHGTNE